jgi:SAM-dependent methyltransferase
LTATASPIQDVPYAKTYLRQTSPVSIAAALGLAGLKAPDPGGEIQVCELGMGHGLSLVAHATALPRARFHGVDFNPAHVQSMHQLAAAVNVSNVQGYALEFGQLAQARLPRMHCVVLHGVWSWVNTETRSVLLKAIDSLLAPGGVLYLSHNVTPGWAAVLPLVQLLHALQQRGHFEGLAPAERMAAARGVVQCLRDHGAMYLDRYPEACAWLHEDADADPLYFLHEFLAGAWQPQHAHEVADELATIGLRHAAPATPGPGLVPFQAGSAELEMRHRLGGPALVRTVDDFLSSRRHRADLFVRDTPPQPPGEHASFGNSLRWAAASMPDDAEVTDLRERGRLLLGHDEARRVLQALQQGPASAADLAAGPGFEGWGRERLLRALLALSAATQAGHVRPALSDVERDRARPGVERFNTWVLEHGVDEGVQVLLDEATGQGIGFTTNTLRQARLFRRGTRATAALALALDAELEAGAVPLRWQGQQLAAGSPERAALLTRAAVDFMQAQAPLMRRLAVL